MSHVITRFHNSVHFRLVYCPVQYFRWSSFKPEENISVKSWKVLGPSCMLAVHQVFEGLRIQITKVNYIGQFASIRGFTVVTLRRPCLEFNYHS